MEMFRTEATAFDVAFGPVDIERMAVIPFRIGIGIGLLCRAKNLLLIDLFLPSTVFSVNGPIRTFSLSPSDIELMMSLLNKQVTLTVNDNKMLLPSSTEYLMNCYQVIAGTWGTLM
jgi:hypothetical protein